MFALVSVAVAEVFLRAQHSSQNAPPIDVLCSDLSGRMFQLAVGLTYPRVSDWNTDSYGGNLTCNITSESQMVASLTFRGYDHAGTTVVVYGDASLPNSLQAEAIGNANTNVPAGLCGIRFANLVPAAPGLDVLVGGQMVETNVHYSEFTPIFHHLLPATTQFETSGSCTASNRSIQWREQVIEPLWESRNDHMIMYQLAQKLGFDKELVKNYKMVKGKGGMDEPEVESILREINASVWTIGYTGQSPERLKAHMRNMNVFDVKTLKAKGGIDKETGYKLDGDYFGLPWPCYGTPALKHPGSPNLYDTSKHVMEGGGNFRANFGVEREGVSLLSGDGSHSKGADLTTGYPEFDHLLLKKLGWWDDLSEAEKKAAEGKNWKTDPSGGIIRVAMQVHGCHPFGNAKARAVVWNFPDPVPQHREPLYSNRPDLIAKYPTHDDKKAFWRLPTLFKTVQDANKDIGKDFPLVMTSGRLVEYEGGGDETRSNPWLAELQQDMFVEINPKVANDRGIRNGEYVWVKTPPMAAVPEFKGLRVKALVTERVNEETVFLPFHFAGRWGGVDLAPYYPTGAVPVVRGESVNTATTYGYDSVTMMQETKTTLCQIERAAA